MRFILFILKCIVGLFASIGFLVVGLLLVVGFLAEQVDDFRAQQVDVPDKIILTVDARDAQLELPPMDFLSHASLGRNLVLRDVVETIDRASRDSKVHALELKTGQGQLGMAQLQELRQAIKRFRDNDKRVFAFAETLGEGGDGSLHYLLGSVAHEIWLQPSGDLDLTGFYWESPFLRGLLDEFGVQPQIVQREEYKGALAFLTEKELPEPQRRNIQALLDSWLTQLIRSVAETRFLDEGTVRALVDDGPYGAEEAKALGLVDRLGYRDELDDAIRAYVGEGAGHLSIAEYHAANPQQIPDDAPRIALIYGLGPIVLGSGEQDSLLGATSLGATAIAQAIRDAVDDPLIDAIIFRVDSPGGSYVASDTIWREVLRAREAGKPLVLSMGNIAASGGYFVAAPAHTILAQPGTITGSIGVVGGKFVTSGLFERFNVGFDSVSAGANAGLWSGSRAFDAGQLARVESWMDRSYEDFLAKVAGGRSMSEEEVRAVAKGQIWTGEDAAAVGLVDALGGYPEAFAFAKQAADIDPQAAVAVEVFPRPFDPIEALADDFLGAEIRAENRGPLAGLIKLLEPLQKLSQLLSSLDEDPRSSALRAGN